MLLTGTCNTCGCTIKLDIGTTDPATAIETIKARTDFECPGRHVELCSPYPHHWPLDSWTLIEGAAETEEEFETRLRGEYLEVRDTNGMSGLITSFAFGMPMTNDGRNWHFVSSPAGKRWYLTNSPAR